MSNFNFANVLLTWYDSHGRKDLPWQQDTNPYYVWISEIMLQQTQVTTVIDYYQRFIKRFPDIQSLAKASEDDVLALWSGLGYYSRARNLHKTAKAIVAQHNGIVPNTLEHLMALPGIGRSTAGAILSLGHHLRFPILDGNVKRVLTRYKAIEGWPSNRLVEQKLWDLAERLLPKQRFANYIQAQMDLGATLCTRSKPQCPICPIQSNCQAYALGSPTLYPTKKPKKAIPTRQTCWLVMLNKNNEVLLEQRPDHGIWSKLWSLPEADTIENIDNDWQQRWAINITEITPRDTFKHIFTHFKLNITPYILSCDITGVTDKQIGSWYKIDHALTLGLPAPVKSLLQQLRQ